MNGGGNPQEVLPGINLAPATSKPEDEPKWSLLEGFGGLGIALAVTFMLAAALAVVFSAFGVDHLKDSAAFNFAATGAQELAFIAGALLVARVSGPISAHQFGFRKMRPRTVYWIPIAIGAYLLISFVYNVIAHPPRDNLPSSFGANHSIGLAIAAGILVIAIAPVVEEFFFRGFLFKAFRNNIGVWPAALLSGLLFGAIHLKPLFLIPLAALGVVLALLHNRTDSLWPCILIHCINNAVAFVLVT